MSQTATVWASRISDLFFWNPPLSEAPPKGHDDPQNRHKSEKQHKRRLGEPGDGGHEKPHHEAENADLPGDVNAGDKGSEREQHEKRQPRSGRGERQLDIRQQHDIHRNQESHPMESLRPYHAETGFRLVDMQPPSRYTDEPNRHGQKLPIADQWLMGNAGISHAKDGKCQHDNIRQFPQPEPCNPRVDQAADHVFVFRFGHRWRPYPASLLAS